MLRVTAILLGVLAGLALAELILRIADWPAPGFYAEKNGPLTLRIPGRLGGAYSPNTSGELRHYEYKVQWSVNAHGFRERTLTPKLPGEWRVGLIGDSFTAGFGVEQDERFGEVWLREVHPHMPNLTIWNLASPMCGTACETDILNGVGIEYHFDEIVLAFYGGNDVEDNIEQIQNETTHIYQQTLRQTVKAWLREHFRLLTFLWVNTVRGFSIFQTPNLYTEADVKRVWQDTERALDRLRAAAGTRSLIILYLPAVQEWDDSVWEDSRQRYGLSANDRFAVKEALRDWVKRNRRELIDSTPWLRTCGSAKNCIFLRDGHWTRQGHLALGEGLARYWIERSKTNH